MNDVVDNQLTFYHFVNKHIAAFKGCTPEVAFSKALKAANGIFIRKICQRVRIGFHDLGIWTVNTFDYLNPSIKLAEQYLAQNKLQHWNNTVIEIISNHHKLTPYKNNHLVEHFRKADLTDLTFGLIKSGISTKQLSECKKQYPAKGFQTFILKKIIKNILQHPLNPLPIVKW